jgi:hypothetical protein
MAHDWKGENMKKFDDIAVKETCDVYTIRIPIEHRYRCAWAKIIVDEKNFILSCISDAGNFSHRWPTEEHRTFKKFLTQIDSGYLMRAPELDMEATCKSLKTALFENRRYDNITKKQARKEYDVIEFHENYGSEDLLFQALVDETETFSDDYSWTGDLFVRKHTPGAITFTEIIFPLFQEALKIELCD